jgi:hypothetical protein
VQKFVSAVETKGKANIARMMTVLHLAALEITVSPFLKMVRKQIARNDPMSDYIHSN